MSYNYPNFYDALKEYTYGEDPQKDNTILTSIVLDLIRYNAKDGRDGLFNLDDIREYKRKIKSSLEKKNR